MLKLKLLLIIIVLAPFVALANSEPAKDDPTTVKLWNQFVNDVYQLHLKQIKNNDFKTSARSGGYHDLPYYFQQISFFEKDSDTLLSKLEWETQQPDKLHAIEVHVHDEKNRVIREYYASYLPKFRNAPYQTLINLHHHNDNYHSFRQFDASDNLIYEVCTSKQTNEKVFEHDDYEIPDKSAPDVLNNKIYQSCFNKLPRRAGLSLIPH